MPLEPAKPTTTGSWIPMKFQKKILGHFCAFSLFVPKTMDFWIVFLGLARLPAPRVKRAAGAEIVAEASSGPEVGRRGGGRLCLLFCCVLCFLCFLFLCFRRRCT